MKSTYLVQRLLPPTKVEGPLGKAHRVFGGGMLGLTKKAWDVLDEVCVVDYMGSAEYEFGTLPRSLHELAQDHEKLVAFEFVVKGRDIKAGWWRERAATVERRKELAAAKKAGKKAKRAKKPHPPEDATFYALCREEHREEVEKRVRLIAADKLRTRDGTLIEYVLDPEPGRDRIGIACGWYELDNGFFFFTDKVMWEGFQKLFGVGESGADGSSQDEDRVAEVS